MLTYLLDNLMFKIKILFIMDLNNCKIEMYKQIDIPMYLIKKCIGVIIKMHV